MAEVVEPRGPDGSIRVRLGEVKLVSSKALEECCDLNALRPTAERRGESRWFTADLTSNQAWEDDLHCWRLRPSGRPIGDKGKREALWKPGVEEINLSADLALAFAGRNRHGVASELMKGDLIWLERKESEKQVTSAADVASIQWARWGRNGERLLDVIKQRHPAVLPDSMRRDGKVDIVTDLFGQVGRDDLALEANAGRAAGAGTRSAPTFAARLRFDNLTFRGAADQLHRGVALAPLQPPHPGCAAFYREVDGPDQVSPRDLPLRGYKVYRTTDARGDDAPWTFESQGVYGDRGQRQDRQRKVNKTVDLLKEGLTGVVRLACLGHSRRELAAVFAACAVDWRLGGGKPLGLGHCRVLKVVARDEEGLETYQMQREGDSIAVLPPELASVLDSRWTSRMEEWQAALRPVEMLRYPRAVAGTGTRKVARGGHVWFGRHASPKRSGGDVAAVGLQVRPLGDDLKVRLGGGSHLAAQVLPRFSAMEPGGDLLYGYDLAEPDNSGDAKKALTNLEPFMEPPPDGEARRGGPPGNDPRRGSGGGRR